MATTMAEFGLRPGITDPGLVAGDDEQAPDPEEPHRRHRHPGNHRPEHGLDGFADRDGEIACSRPVTVSTCCYAPTPTV
jgi:hypothetical protein